MPFKKKWASKKKGRKKGIKKEKKTVFFLKGVLQTKKKEGICPFFGFRKFGPLDPSKPTLKANFLSMGIFRDCNIDLFLDQKLTFLR